MSNLYEKTTIKGLYLINKKIFNDNRGTLIKPYSELFFDGLDINSQFVETWFTKSNKSVIRGMHFQMGSNPSEKMVSAIKGRVLDVIIDLRKDSPTFKETFSIELSEDLPWSLYIPVGCAHGYKVLEDQSIVMYQATKVHSGPDDIGIHWQSFDFDWNISSPILSDRDLELPPLSEYLKTL